MRTIPTALQTELSSASPRIARIIKLTRTDGAVLGFTDHDFPLTVAGVTYNPAPGLSALRYTSTADASVSTQELAAATIEVPDEDLEAGLFDDALIEAAWCSWANPSAGKVVIFVGKIGEITWSEEGFRVELTSTMKQLERNLGQTYTSSCRHELYGTTGAGKVGACGVNPATFTFTGTVASIVLSKWKFTYSGPAAAKDDDFFTNGVLTFLTGNNAGLSVVIKADASNTFEVFLPTAFAINVGDTFSVKAGCDKTLDTCKAKFNNVANFGGFPHINTDVTFR